MTERADQGPLIGDVIAGRYRIDSIVGEGGMGIIYEAEHLILRQRVAIKALLPSAVTSPDVVERFSREAAAVARLANEHIVRIMDAGALPNGSPYLVMELLEGLDLNALLERSGPLHPAVAVDLALQALEALAHAHAARVIHRDIKPANLFLTRTADGRQILKLVDFGVARSFDGSIEEGWIAGSPVYMSPEQLTNETLDERTDLWSFGVVLYELISGAAPFGGSLANIVTSIRNDDVVPLSEVRPTVDLDLSAIIGKCLLRDRNERWASCSELAHALARHGTGGHRDATARIDRVLSMPARPEKPRRFESVEEALRELELVWHGESAPETAPSATASETLPASVQALGSCGPQSVARLPHEGAIAFEPTLRPPGSEPGLAPLKILLIDDSQITIDLYVSLLTKAGFVVRATTSADEFEALIEEWRPHLALLDVQMPGLDGVELCRRIKARVRGSVPMAFVSVLSEDQLAEHARQAGADAFFTKTGDWRDLVDFVRSVCALAYSPEHLPDAVVE